MGYTTFLMGSLLVDGEVQRISKIPVPTVPELDLVRRHGGAMPSGDLLIYQGGSISIGNTQPGHAIQWIKPNGINLLVADRVLLSNIAWETLDREGFVNGKVVCIEERRYLCRLLRVGISEHDSNEWDECLDETGEGDELWHWNLVPFWGRERFLGDALNMRPGECRLQEQGRSGEKTLISEGSAQLLSRSQPKVRPTKQCSLPWKGRSLRSCDMAASATLHLPQF